MHLLTLGGALPLFPSAPASFLLLVSRCSVRFHGMIKIDQLEKEVY